jgi:hypothetical protein
MLLCDLGALEAPEGPFADPATTARRARNAPAGATLGRAMSGARARNGDAVAIGTSLAASEPPVAHRARAGARHRCVRAQKHFSLQSPI